MYIYLRDPILTLCPYTAVRYTDFSSGLEPPGEFQTPSTQAATSARHAGGRSYTHPSEVSRRIGLLICYLVTILRQVLHGLPAVISGSAFQLNILFIRSSEEVMGPCTMAMPYRIVFATTG